LVRRAFVAVKLVATALVVVELPTMRLVKLASVARSEEKNPLVLVLLAEKRLVAVALDAVRELVVRMLAVRLVADVVASTV
jgi:hypothetical protein